MARFFSFDGENYFPHDTAEEAKEAAQLALDDWREQAVEEGEWSESAEHVCWGEIREAVVEKSLTGVDLDYELQPIDDES